MLVRCISDIPVLNTLRRHLFLDFDVDIDFDIDIESMLPTGDFVITIVTRRVAPNGRLECPSSPVPMPSW